MGVRFSDGWILDLPLVLSQRFKPLVNQLEGAGGGVNLAHPILKSGGWVVSNNHSSVMSSS